MNTLLYGSGNGWYRSATAARYGIVGQVFDDFATDIPELRVALLTDTNCPAEAAVAASAHDAGKTGVLIGQESFYMPVSNPRYS